MRTVHVSELAQFSSRLPSATRKNAARVEVLLFGWPFAAQVGLGWPAVGSLAAVQAAPDPIVVQISTGGDDLGLNREVPGPLHFAEIRRAPGAHQSLQLPLPLGAHDLDLEIPATGGPT
jgi:hypothetical protein